MKQRIQAILQHAGLKTDAPLVRASGGQRNQTWICGDFVVRMNSQNNSRALQLEAELLARIANTIPCPNVYAVGVDQMGEWSIQQKVAGRPLAHVWSELDLAMRQSAVEQLAEFARRLHSGKMDDLALPRFPSIQEIHHQIVAHVETCRAFPFVDSWLMDQIVALSQELSQKLDESDETVLIHGDLHFDNILWEGNKITAILDLEKAGNGPAVAELDLFLRYCAFPQLFVQEPYEYLTCAADYRDVPLWFASAYPELFQTAQLTERLSLYSLVYDLSLLREFPPNRQVDPNIEDELLNRLHAIVNHESYLSKWLL